MSKGSAIIAPTSIGSQSRYTTAVPQQTLFKNAYRHHTGFAMTDRDNTFSGTMSYGQTVTARIDRSADILSNITVTIRLTSLYDPEYEIIDIPKFLVHTTEPIDVLVSNGRLTTKIYKKNLPPGMFYGPLGTSNKKVSYLLAIDSLYDYTGT